MKKENLKLYAEKYRNINSDLKKRIYEYIESHRFSSKDFEELDKDIDRILNIDKEIIKIVLDIIPEPTPRPRLNFRNGNFYVSNAKTNNEFFRVLVSKEELLQDKIYTPVTFTCNTYFPIPSGMNKKEVILAELGLIKPPITKDWDNLGKTYSDMVQKWLLINDGLITKGTSEKFWSLKPRVEITLEYLIEFDCKYNERLITKSKSYIDSFK